ncbi:hypothetical protein JYT28_00170 [Desulfobulbus sp. AH-315-M07]|nr:hypothetical protein [Desulfobulbus sp. AH-315-M07]
MNRFRLGFLACALPFLVLACGSFDDEEAATTTTSEGTDTNTATVSVTASGAGGASGTTGAGAGSGVGGGAGVGGGDPAPTWDNFAAVFFADYCNGCHSPAGQAVADFSMLSVVQQRLDSVACGVSPTTLDYCAGKPNAKQFPAGGGPKPDDATRVKLVEWCEAGGPQ